MELRFWEKVRKTENCWVWTGSFTRQGYGRFWLDGKTQQAHRIAWSLAYGPVPDNLQVCHRCDNRGCVRPDHLFLGTQLDNMRDMIAKGRKVVSVGPRNGKWQTHCIHGHPLDGDNLVWKRQKGRPKRYCRICTNEATRRARERKRQSNVICG